MGLQLIVKKGAIATTVGGSRFPGFNHLFI